MQIQHIYLFIIILAIHIMSLGCHSVPSVSDASAGEFMSERCFEPQAGSPTIQDLQFLGTLPHQHHTLRFKIDWRDTEANLRGGRYQFFTDGIPLSILPLPEMYIANASEGSFELLLPLKADNLAHGKQIRIELMLWDAKGLGSNRPLILLKTTLAE
jgi:hypothetical protein